MTQITRLSPGGFSGKVQTFSSRDPALGLELDWDYDGTFSPAEGTISLGITEVLYNHTGLLPCTMHYYRLRTVRIYTGEASAYTNTAQAKTLCSGSDWRKRRHPRIRM